MVEQRKRYPICGHYLEKYPNNGEPLIHGEVCLTCNSSVIIPYRYFVHTYKTQPYAMLIRNGKINLIKASDEKFILSDIELYLGHDLVFKDNAKLGLTFAFIKGYEEEPKELNKVALNALKAPNFKSVLIIPSKLMKGVKKNE